jgi:hypothetical protein
MRIQSGVRLRAAIRKDFAVDEVDDVETRPSQRRRQRGIGRGIVVRDEDFAHQRAIDYAYRRQEPIRS